MKLLQLGFLGEMAPQIRLVEESLAENLKGEGIQEVTAYLLQGKGKRVRSALTLLAAGSFGPLPPTAVPVATAVEMLHLATLIHDDVIDGATTRHGLLSLHRRFNERISILLGDHLFAKAFVLFASVGNVRVVRTMANVVYEMCQGEIEQNLNCYQTEVQTEGKYLERIGKKTAILMGESCRVGAILAHAGRAMEDAMYDYGYNLGLGFQITDDLLDLTADTERLGKASGSDLKSGVVTLPLIHALKAPGYAGRIRELLRPGIGDTEVAEARELLAAAGSLEYASVMAEKHLRLSKEALVRLPEGPNRNLLQKINDFVGKREF